MDRCFIIQPFDGGKFDKRYEDIFVPAVRDAQLEPYRVDRDLGTRIPIEDVHRGIVSASICLADISLDNPNVWFELGYAIALSKEVILVCSNERDDGFPFDVQHRHIIKYTTESTRDFDGLKSEITERARVIVARRAAMKEVAQLDPIAQIEGLEPYHVATLVSVAEELDDLEEGLSPHRIRASMEQAGFTKIATTLGLDSLCRLEFLEAKIATNYDHTEFTAYKVTTKGMDWLHNNRNRLTLHREKLVVNPHDQDIPF